MRPLFHPHLVNDPFGDSALYVDCLFEHRALLFDLGDLHRLPARKILRLTDVFVSHTHMDHFIGFDQLIRLCLGRDRALRLFGPPGFVDQVAHRLGGYTWNLVENYTADFTLVAIEYDPAGFARSVRFRCRRAFAREDLPPTEVHDGVLLDERDFIVRAVHLDHGVYSLGFALEEKQHLNIWKNYLEALGLPTGPWLRALKLAILRDEPADSPFEVRWRDRDGEQRRVFPLGHLRDQAVHRVPGQKIAYVTDVVHHADNARRIIALAQGANLFFCEATFLDRDADRAAETRHLTASQAGALARAAQVENLIPFHYSARYAPEGAGLEAEAKAAFRQPKTAAAVHQ